MDLISTFINRYRREYDYYEQAARLVWQLLDSSLQSAGIRAIVTYRAKSPARLEEKIRQRAAAKDYQTDNDIYNDIVDLAGARVALYFPGERGQLDTLIRQTFLLESAPKEFAGTTKPSDDKRFSGYWATHYRVRLRDGTLSEAQKRYAEARVEIQVASVLMHAWAEVDHDLVYKPLQGKLLQEEYAILDELNGLVIAGEIALQRLQKAGEARVAVGGRRFANHYELAAYLLNKAAPLLQGPASDGALGRVDLLYGLLDRLQLATPDQLSPYVSALSSDTERRPLAEQIVDQLLAEDESRYRLYEEVRAAQNRALRFWSPEERLLHPEIQGAIGFFLTQWIAFERMTREASADREKSRAVVPTRRVLERLGILDPQARADIERIRRLRNNLVHGVEIPDFEEIREAGQRLAQILSRLRGPEQAV